MKIFMDRMRLLGRSYTPEAVARGAYAEAKAFVQITEAIRNGEEIGKVPGPRPRRFCKVRVWQMDKPAKTDQGDPWFEIQPVDEEGFAPNIPEEHPANQRYGPNAERFGILCTEDGKMLTPGRHPFSN